MAHLHELPSKPPGRYHRAFVDSGFHRLRPHRHPGPALRDADRIRGRHQTRCAYPPTALVNALGEWLASRARPSCASPETEKYAHVTFFFNGGEERLLHWRRSRNGREPKVATSDLQPEIGSEELTDKLVAAIKSGKYNVIICRLPERRHGRPHRRVRSGRQSG
ncbi:hypothetical protein ACNKHQ_21085 [Shigella flexneri]